MKPSAAGPLVVAIFAAVLARPAAADGCREDELDAPGRCPRRRIPPPPQLDVRGADIAGAEVSLDGKPAGRAPLVLRTTPGRHLVEVRRDGFAPYAAWIEVKQGEQRLIDVKLQPAVVDQGTPPEKGGQKSIVTTKPPSCLPGMVAVNGGTFEMGNPQGVGLTDGAPAHTVTLSGYCIDKLEVTVKAYGACVVAKACTPVDLTSDKDCNRNDRPGHPVDCVDWSQAAAYCKWAGKRLPTEAEWEYAARGADGRLYPWGNAAPSAKLLNASGSERGVARRTYDGNDGWKTTAPVGSFAAGASPFGVLDMSGNVWEWTADWLDHYPAAPAANPQGPKAGDDRVFRGGGWGNDRAIDVSAVARAWADPAYTTAGVGFRCAR